MEGTPGRVADQGTSPRLTDLAHPDSWFDQCKGGCECAQKTDVPFHQEAEDDEMGWWERRSRDPSRYCGWFLSACGIRRFAQFQGRTWPDGAAFHASVVPV